VKAFLRELFVTLDVLLGADHSARGHQPPEYVLPPTLPPTKPRNIP
jgi:hypothetical protein